MWNYCKLDKYKCKQPAILELDCNMKKEMLGNKPGKFLKAYDNDQICQASEISKWKTNGKVSTT